MTSRMNRSSWVVPGLLVVAVLGATGSALAVIQGTSWFPIGPAPSCCFFPGGEGGRATALAMNPLNSGEVWIGAANGGLWRSGDGAATWEPMTDDQASMAIGSIALADCTIGACDSVYAGTGENAIRRDTYYGRGLLVGRRVGPLGQMQWQLRTGTPYNFTRGSIYNVVLDPATSGESRRIYVSLSSGVTASASESTVTAPEMVLSGGGGGVMFRSVVDYGLYTSLNDGLTWAKLIVPGTTGHRPTDLEMDPTDSDTLYAGFLGRGIFKSGDAGATWCPLNPGFPVQPGCPQTSGLPDHAGSTPFDHVEIALDPADSNHLYATFGHCPDRLVQDCQPSVYETTNGGVDWVQRFAGTDASTPGAPCPTGYSRYTHALAVYPADPGTLYLGGIRLCKSTDHGQTWASDDLNTYPGKFGSLASIHFDHRAVVFDAIGVRGYSVNDGGIAVWQYPGTRWTPRNENLQAIGFQAVDTSPLTPRVLGGTQDNSGLLWLGAKQWKNTVCCGDAGYAVMDDRDAMKMYTTTNTSDLSALVVVPTRSTDGGEHWSHADGGIPDSDPRSFYPPLVQGIDPTTQDNLLYFGTNLLYRSSDDADSWTPVSPLLSSVPSSEIFSGVDVITAIAVAPSDANRIYLGFYSGRVFATDDASSGAPTWYEMTFNLPGEPITWLAVHPTNREIVYATLSGFFPGSHVFMRNAIVLSHWFPLGGIADLNGVPANTISIEAANPSILWLGTDRGLYKSLNGGGSWFKFGTGMPNAPVYQISLDETRGRVVAATHGRGAFMLTGPSLEAYGGCMNDFVYDLAVLGHGFHPQHVCTMKLLRQDSSVCAAAMIDASGGSIQTSKEGVLATWKTGEWANDPVVWGCLHGKCLNNKTAAACNVPGNPLSAVVAYCDNQVAFAQVPGCPTLTSPPSSWLSLTGDLGGFLAPRPQASVDPDAGRAGTSAGAGAASGEGTTSLAASLDPALIGSGSFRLLPTLQSGDGASRTLCSVNVPYMPSDTATMILERARDLVNADPNCMLAGVSAAVQPAFLELEAEDQFPSPGRLHLSAPGLVGSQLIPSVEVGPGPIQGPCFELGSFGVPVHGQLQVVQLGITATLTGAAGGDIAITGTSPLGVCHVSVPTNPGDSADSIAAAIEAAFAQPDPTTCPASANPHDVKKQAGGLILVMSNGLQICVEDAGLGLTIAPAEICFADADCDDVNPCTQDSCDTDTGRCQHPAEPDGLPCDDLSPCTVGDFCQAGACGQPVFCDDFNPCTEDSCDPVTGACTSADVECDDGNSCTFDACNPELGGCDSFPNVGGTCDDGDACTQGDFCDVPPGGGAPICRGVNSCDDGNPCTADTCDPITGACQQQPIQCDDGNPCTADFCNVDTGACEAIPTPDAPCDDADACTIDDHCVQDAVGGIACVGAPLTCDDQNLCTTDSCDPGTGTCTHTPILCDDGQGCTDDVCLPTSGQCIHPPRNCDDNDACTSDSCEAPGCLVPDNGGGTADLLPAGCGYTTHQDLMIIDGLPAGTTIRIPAVLDGFTCPPASPAVCSFPSPVPGLDCSTGTPAAGEQSCSNATLSMHLVGGGLLAGLVRDIPLGLSTEVRLDPRVPFDPLQSFDTDLFRLYGQLPTGDPDFDLLRIVAGTDFGLPSPGHTTLTQSGGSWAVDSFFDITYRIDFIGSVSGAMAGMSGSTTGTARIRTGAGWCVHQPVACDDGDPCTVDTCDPATGSCVSTPVSCDDNDACTTDSCDPQTGACVHTPITCDDDNACTVNDRCVPIGAGTMCQGDFKDCQDGDPCTEDSCIQASGECAHAPTDCDDNDACTSDSCAPLGCVVPDNGGGTADLPPAGCPYVAEEKLLILDGIQPAGSIEIDAVHSGFSCPAVLPTGWVCSFPSPIPGVDCSQGTPLAGEQSCAASVLAMHMVGTGVLAGFVRDIPLAVSFEEHLNPRVPGIPVQSFDTDIVRLFGQLPPGDPDFDLLRITCGSDFALPNPGHTTLLQMGGNWGVDSFHDRTCRIDFVGAPGSPLMGRSGSTTGTYRFRTRGGQCLHQPVDCDDGDACTVDSCDPAIGTCLHGPVNCDDNDACTLDSCDPIEGCRHLVPPVVEPGPALFESQTVASWPASPGATHWNTYRGTIPANMLGSRLPASVYDQACFESADAQGDGPTQTTDGAIPPLGTGFYYLVSAEGDCAESAIGHASSGAPIPNTLACPSPP